MSSNIKNGVGTQNQPRFNSIFFLISQNLAAVLDAVFIGILLNDNTTMALTF
jgi:hypothetical protein